MPRNSFGDLLRKLRTDRKVTLRAFCLKNAFDPGNFSRIERGLFPAPQSQEILKKYAGAFELEPGSDEWLEFFDAAAVSKGQIPPDLLSDAEVVEKLPVLFRTLRGKPVPPEKLDELVEIIRRS